MKLNLEVSNFTIIIYGGCIIGLHLITELRIVNFGHMLL